MKKIVRELTVVNNSPLNHDNYRLVVESDIPLPDFKAGQFVNIQIAKATDILLRRPFSLFDVDREKRRFSLLIKILGRGSRVLTSYRPGDHLSMVYPLGKGFSLPTPNDRILLVGGGSGVAPMLFLAKTCGLPAARVDLLLGARAASDHIDCSDYRSFGTIYRVTEDGQLGEKGLVTDHSVYKSKLQRYSKIYSCGPGPMMRAIAKDADELNIFCEVSLENTMACGFGACLCCVEKTTTGNRCVCTDGPVFNSKELIW